METNLQDLILKWLDGSLTEAERQAFEQMDDYGELVKLSETAKSFKAPDFDAVAEFKHLQKAKRNQAQVIPLWPKVLKVVAVVAILVSVYLGFFHSSETLVKTAIAQQIELVLPDNSKVTLNGESSLAYKKKTWDDERTLQIDGEAFFKVTKGATFSVETEKGVVTVLGTEFNVKYRDSILEVTCYEGLVEVRSGIFKRKLSAGESYKVDSQDYEYPSITNLSQARWLNNRSQFDNAKLADVFSELEHQYDVEVVVNNVDANQRFTGAFGYDDLEMALKSITQPMDLTYKIEGNTITLSAVD